MCGASKYYEVEICEITAICLAASKYLLRYTYREALHVFLIFVNNVVKRNISAKFSVCSNINFHCRYILFHMVVTASRCYLSPAQLCLA